MIVVECDDSWSAIEPDQRIWNKIPGAHYRWRANISRSEGEFGGADVFWIDYERVADFQCIDSLQGYDGWLVTTKTMDNKISVTFTHKNSN